MEHVYMKPWCRVGPYAVGVFAGYILYKTNCKLRMPKVSKSFLQIYWYLIFIYFCKLIQDMAKCHFDLLRSESHEYLCILIRKMCASDK